MSTADQPFGELLHAARVRVGMSQRKLAKELGMSQSGVAEWEHGKRGIKLSTVAQIAEILGIDQSELWPVVRHERGNEEEGEVENLKLGVHGRVVGAVPITCPKPHPDGPHQGALIVFEDGYKEIMCTVHDGQVG